MLSRSPSPPLRPKPRWQMWKANLTEHPPVLDWSLEYGPRTLLYDVCRDPSETTDLSRTDKGRKETERLYAELLEELRDAVRN